MGLKVWTKRGRVFIFRMCFPGEICKIFHTVILNEVTLILSFTLIFFSKSVSLVMTFESEDLSIVDLHICHWAILSLWHILTTFWPSDLVTLHHACLYTLQTPMIASLEIGLRNCWTTFFLNSLALPWFHKIFAVWLLTQKTSFVSARCIYLSWCNLI